MVQTSLQSDSAVGNYGRPKSRDSNRDNFVTPFRESQEFVPFGCSLHCELQRILYGGRWRLPLSPGCGESCVSKCRWLVPTPKGVPNAKLTSCGWFFFMQIHIYLYNILGGRPFHPSVLSFVPSSIHLSSSSRKKKMMEEEEDNDE